MVPLSDSVERETRVLGRTGSRRNDDTWSWSGGKKRTRVLGCEVGDGDPAVLATYEFEVPSATAIQSDSEPRRTQSGILVLIIHSLSMSTLPSTRGPESENSD